MRSFFFFVCAIIASITSISHAFPAISDVAITAMEWTGPSKGTNVTLYGTASEIMSQLKKLDPQWIPASTSSEAKHKHHSAPITSTCCPIEFFKPVLRSAASRAAHDLISIGGKCTAAAEACSIKSCHEDAGIYLCNEKNKTIDVPCDTIGSLTKDLIYGCPTTNGTVCGTISDHHSREEGWHVEVKYCVPL